MASLDVSTLPPPDACSGSSFGHNSIFSTHLAEVERQTAIAAEAGRQAGLHLARHFVARLRKKRRGKEKLGAVNPAKVERRR
ncbi:MAG: hypothetical protein L0Y60_03560 [Beijerinckiaceae bacterium]|nr:hypothetical protein [Beijerinckiaceae bacterium]